MASTETQQDKINRVNLRNVTSSTKGIDGLTERLTEAVNAINTLFELVVQQDDRIKQLEGYVRSLRRSTRKPQG